MTILLPTYLGAQVLPSSCVCTGSRTFTPDVPSNFDTYIEARKASVGLLGRRHARALAIESTVADPSSSSVIYLQAMQ